MGADLADMQLISNYNKLIIFWSCLIDTFIKYAWVVHFKDKKDTAIVMLFRKFQMIKKEIQIKYGLNKVVNFTTHQLSLSYKMLT